MRRSTFSKDKEKIHRDGLTEALRAGYSLLEEGYPALDAVEAAIRTLEDNPLFNAGKGAVFTHDRKNELDASIMDGRSLKAGAVGSVTIIKNPITAARLVMEQSPHVFLTGKGAETFAKKMKLPLVKNSYFATQVQLDDLKKVQAREKAIEEKLKRHPNAKASPHQPTKLGTVGAVAIDYLGNIAAGTSTGGTVNKRYGRVGDTPLIGAGTYAKNGVVGISATGDGEYFIRAVAAHEIAALMEYKGYSLERAQKEVIHHRVGKLGGTGGVIGIDSTGKIAMNFNTPGMYRGWVGADGKINTAIFGKS